MSEPAAVEEPLLELKEIQGSILAGFNKDHQTLLALKIRDLAAARRWLQRILPEINNTEEVLAFNNLFRARRKRLKQEPHGLVATWVNIAFTHDGLAQLTSAAEVDALPDLAFKIGLNSARAQLLGDPPPEGTTDPTAQWVVGGTNKPVDILVIVASDRPRLLAEAVRRVRPSPKSDGKGAPAVVWKETGGTRPDLPGHEHFGFKDGVSQPGVRGLISRDPPVYLTRRLLQPPADGDIAFSAPGQPLIWPGQFVLGYPRTSIDAATAGGPVPPDADLPDLAKNGSYLVFRRLRQDVAAFYDFLVAEAKRLAATAGLEGLTASRLGALVVGRWPSGAPIARAPATDSEELAKDRLANNDFLFLSDTPPPDFLPGVSDPGGAFPRAREDRQGAVCPHAAHIRKVNPRDHTTDLGDPFDTLTRRILRRGNPYGPPLVNPAADDGADRGLHFLCYQSSIEQQFELLQQDWANTDQNPAPLGHDLVIGQPGAGIDRHLQLFSDSGAEEVVAKRLFVTPTGGGYFFAPSLSALRRLSALPD